MTFYSQLEERLKDVAPGSMRDRLSFLFDDRRKDDNKGGSSSGGSGSKMKPESTTSTRNTASRKSSRKSSRNDHLYSEDDNADHDANETNINSSAAFESGTRQGTTMQSLRTMSVSELRYFLNLRKIPHRDCIEKIELLFRAQQALEKEQGDHVTSDFASGVNVLSSDNEVDREEKAAWETSSDEEDQTEEQVKKTEEVKEEVKEEEEDEDDDLVFRLSRRSGKRSKAAAAAADIDTKASGTTIDHGAQERRKKQHALRRAKRRAAKKSASSSTLSSSSSTTTTATRRGRHNRTHNHRAEVAGGEDTGTTNIDTSSRSTTGIATTAINMLPTPEKRRQQQQPPPPLLPTVSSFDTTSTTFFTAPPPVSSSAAAPPPPTFRPSDVTNQRIEERRLREELEKQQREKDAVAKLRGEERRKEAEAEETASIQGKLRHEVQHWAMNKSLIRMLCTLDKIMPPDRIALPTLKLRLSSTTADVKTAYKQALRCVHPDKLSTATTNDRVRGEYVFNALREAFAKSSENGGTVFGPVNGGSGGGYDSGNNRPLWAQRW